MTALLSTQHLKISIGKRILAAPLSLSMHPGEIWGILGPNGVGKTTLLHTLAGLHPPATGEIYLQNRPMASLPPKSIAQEIAILFQSSQDAFPETIFEYVTAARFPHLDYFSKPQANDMAIIHAALSCMELDTLKHRPLPSLSGGERRRAAISAVLAQTPRIYLLDEPTNHLDIYYQQKVLTHLQQLAPTTETAMIMSLHDLNHAQAFCTHVILMYSDGSIRQGNVCDIMTEENLSQLYNVTISRGIYDNSGTRQRCVWQYGATGR